MCERFAGRTGGTGGGGGGQSDGGMYTCMMCAAPYKNCENAMPPAPVWMTHAKAAERKANGETCWMTGGGGQGGGDVWNGGEVELTNTKQSTLFRIQDFMRQAEEMARSARESGVDIGKEFSAYRSAVETAGACIKNAQTMAALNACGDTRSIEAQGRTIWDRIQAGGMMRQVKDIDRQVEDMRRVIDDIARGGGDVSAAKSAYATFRSAVDAAKQAMQNSASTPDQTRVAMDNVFRAQSEAWRTIENTRGPQDRDGGPWRGGDMSQQCEMIRRKMEHVQNQAEVSQLQGLYMQCSDAVRGAVSGKDFDQEDFRDIQEEFTNYGHEKFARNSCAMAGQMIDDAIRMLKEEAPATVAKVAQKNPAGAEKLKVIVGQVQQLVARAQEEREKQRCDDAMRAMGDMEKLGRQADAIIGSSAGGDGAFEVVDYGARYDDVAKNVSKAGTVDMRKFKEHLKRNGYEGPALAMIESMDPAVIAQLIEFAGGGTGGETVVKAAAQAEISPVALDEIIASQKAVQEELKALREENAKLAASMQGILDDVAGTTFHKDVAPEAAKFLQDAATMTAAQRREALQALAEKSAEAYFQQKLIAFTDTNPFGKDGDKIAWYASAAKNLADAGIIKGVAPGKFAGEQPTTREMMAVMFARWKGVEEKGDVDEASAYARGASSWAREGIAGIEGFTGDEARKFFDGPQAGGATRLEAARLIYALSDRPEVDQSVLASYTDIKGLGEEDLNAIAYAVAQRTMVGDGIEWKPKDTFNRAQLAKVLNDILTAEEADDGEEDDSREKTSASAPVTGAGSATQSSFAASSEAFKAAAPVEPDWQTLFTKMSIARVKAVAAEVEAALGTTLIPAVIKNAQGELIGPNPLYLEANGLSKIILSATLAAEEMKKNGYPDTVYDKIDLFANLTAQQVDTFKKVYRLLHP